MAAAEQQTQAPEPTAEELENPPSSTGGRWASVASSRSRGATRSARSSGRPATRTSPARMTGVRAGVGSKFWSQTWEHRRAEVLRPHDLAGARAEREADDRPRRRRSLAGDDGRLLRERGGGADVRGRAEGDPRQSARRLQLAGLVQPRLRGEAAGLGVLHPLDRGLDGVDPRLDPPRGGHLPRGLRVGRQPLAPPLVEGAALERRLRQRASRSASCAAPTRPRARSSRAARRGAPRRWSCSTSTIPTSRSSSGARRARSGRRASSRAPATT